VFGGGGGGGGGGGPEAHKSPVQRAWLPELAEYSPYVNQLPVKINLPRNIESPLFTEVVKMY
jgi:hypothetical protein